MKRSIRLAVLALSVSTLASCVPLHRAHLRRHARLHEIHHREVRVFAPPVHVHEHGCGHATIRASCSRRHVHGSGCSYHGS